MTLKTTTMLASIVLFAGLSPGERQALAATMQRHRYAKGELIFQQGDPGGTLYVIATGTVKIALSAPDGRELLLALLGPGDFFGELSLLDGAPRSADAIAQEDCQLLLLRRENFLAFLNGHPEATKSLLRVLARRLRATDEVVHEAAFLDLPGRVARLLLRLGQTHGRPEQDGVVLGLRLTHAELASMVGSSRESISRLLKHWQRQGLIRYHAGLLTLVRPEVFYESGQVEEEASTVTGNEWDTHRIKEVGG